MSAGPGAVARWFSVGMPSWLHWWSTVAIPGPGAPQCPTRFLPRAASLPRRRPPTPPAAAAPSGGCAAAAPATTAGLRTGTAAARRVTRCTLESACQEAMGAFLADPRQS